jgi:hypothetical protein
MNTFETILTLTNLGTLSALWLVHRSLSQQVQGIISELNRPMPDPLAQVWKKKA